MRKIVLLLLPIIIIGCEQTFDNIIDVLQNNFQVISVGPTEDVIYQPDDSLITITINFSNSSEVTNVFCDVFASDQSKLNASPFPLLDNGNNSFSNEFPLSEFYPNGVYNIKYYVKNADETLQQVAATSFKYNNGQNQVSPIISNLEIPDSVETEETFIFSVEASDANGLNDIDSVFFELYRPDGSIVEISPGVTKFLMHDDGNFEVFGDLVAGDGIFSFKNSFAATAQKGIWKFVFQANDRSGNFSNIIEHFILIQ